MITSKTVFITNDGQQHDTDQRAYAYIENAIQEDITSIMPTLTSYKDLIAVVNALAGDMKAIKRTADIFNKWLSGAVLSDEEDSYKDGSEL